jgi:hypothetical protein
MAGVARDRALRLLETGEMKLLGLMPRASNYTFLAEVSDGDLRALAVYKPRDGETPLWDFPDGTLCLREVAAYVVGEALGWGLVPPTVLRDGPHGEGSVQLFIDHDPSEHYLTLAPRFGEVFRKVAAFDVILNNADRKSGHCLLESSSGRIFVVDHGVSFHPHPKLRTVIWDFAGEPVPEEITRDVGTLADALSADGEATERLASLLAGEELEALAGRARALANGGRYPAPGPGRPYPWPAV